MRQIVILVLLWFISGCTSSNRSTTFSSYSNIPTSVLIYSESLKPFASIWSTEVHRRYPDSILVLSHGDDIDGSWWCEYPDEDRKRLVSELVDQIRVQYPLRRIVLVICNPGGYVLDTPNISYSISDVWIVPDRNLDIRSSLYPNAVGNIYEMQEN